MPPPAWPVPRPPRSQPPPPDRGGPAIGYATPPERRPSTPSEAVPRADGKEAGSPRGGVLATLGGGGFRRATPSSRSWSSSIGAQRTRHTAVTLDAGRNTLALDL